MFVEHKTNLRIEELFSSENMHSEWFKLVKWIAVTRHWHLIMINPPGWVRLVSIILWAHFYTQIVESKGLRSTSWNNNSHKIFSLMTLKFYLGFFLPRTGSDRFPLPSARFISNTVLGTASRPASFSTVLPAFGQFLIHDMELVPVSDGQLLFGIYLD